MGTTWFTSTFLNFLKFTQIKEGGPDFLVGTNSAERQNYLVPHSVFCNSFSQIFEIWETQILRHLLDFNWFYEIQQHFIQFFEISSN